MSQVRERPPVLGNKLGYYDVWPGMKLSASHNGEQILVRAQLGGIEPVRSIFSRIDSSSYRLREEVVFSRDSSFTVRDLFTADNLLPGRYAVFADGKAIRYKGNSIGKHAVAEVDKEGKVAFLGYADPENKPFVPPSDAVYIKLEEEWEIETHRHWYPELYTE